MPNDQDKQTEGQQEGAAKETDYKALWEQAKAEAELNSRRKHAPHSAKSSG